MNYTYFGNRIERSSLGNMELQLLEAQEKLVSQEYEVENLRIKAAKNTKEEEKIFRQGLLAFLIFIIVMILLKVFSWGIFYW